MSEVIVAILIFIGVICVTVLLFGTWVILSVLRMIGRALGIAPASRHGRMYAATAPNLVRCNRPRCHAENPMSAQFCRRCGHSMHGDATPAALGRERIAV